VAAELAPLILHGPNDWADRSPPPAPHAYAGMA
jgi:hypothetical protein